MEILTAVVALLILAAFYQAVFDKIKTKSKVDSRVKTPYIYRKKQYLMTRAENEFYQRLVTLFSDQYFIFPQVHLSELLDGNIKGQSWKGALSHIQRKSVDFVICDKVYISPLIAIELDDSSHKLPDRVERDRIVEEIFANASMRLLRIDMSHNVSDEDIQRTVLSAIS